jgi:hypothetical protein
MSDKGGLPDLSTRNDYSAVWVGTSFSTESFVTQGDKRVHPHCALCRHQASGHTDGHQQYRNARKDYGIGCAYTEKRTPH